MWKITILKWIGKMLLQFGASVCIDLAAKKTADKLYDGTATEEADFFISKWEGPTYML